MRAATLPGGVSEWEVRKRGSFGHRRSSRQWQGEGCLPREGKEAGGTSGVAHGSWSDLYHFIGSSESPAHTGVIGILRVTDEAAGA